MRIAPLDAEIRLGAGHEEGADQMPAIESLEIDLAAIHDVEGACLGDQLIEDVDVVHLAVAENGANAIGYPSVGVTTKESGPSLST